MKPRLETPSCETCQSRLKNVFCHLNDEDITEMSISKTCRTYKKGLNIFSETSKPSGLFCISNGNVKLFKLGYEGKEQIIRFAKEGDILGYRSLISGDIYTASAEALEESKICFIPKSTFFDLLQKNSNVSAKLMQLLSSDLRNAEHRITMLANKPVRERMAETLLMLKEFYGLEEDKQTIKAVLTREDISNIVGTATETAIRIISDFKTEKIIDTEGKKIKIINIPTLTKAANIYD